MLISKYSAPDFNPYQNEDPEEPPTLWAAPHAQGPLRASLTLPGSKSLTNRELVLAALADGPSTLHAPLHSRDTDGMADALRALGVTIDEVSEPGAFGKDWRVTPGELVGSTTIDCGQAGTIMRFLPPVAALALGPTTIDADASARSRPMSALIDALRLAGVDINDDGRGRLPFTVHGTGRLPGGEVSVDASASSQFLSALLLAGARFEQGIHVTHTGPSLPSLPHIRMTVACLAAHGVAVHEPGPAQWLIEPGAIRATDTTIEPDLSNAAPFLAAALVAGGSVTIEGWPATTTQVGGQLVRFLPLFGGKVEAADGRLTATGTGRVSPVRLDLSEAGELAPTLTALAALADGPSDITGIGHIRFHETDRIQALTDEINALGGQVTATPDGLHIEPRALHGGVWQSHDDHRMATSGALLGLAVPGVEIDGIGSTAKTLPQFPELWTRMYAEHG
ncbi:MAG TPA: 3-phosphoshikimate 1-carboxyvinyltransferase [Microbacteriaceae bacterium]|nr:3-phosphoshikimate 1-carboxyvinyltransferase [Microbacteriaceae bacterium]